MGTYVATVNWSRAPTEAFTDMRYSRAHTWRFDCGIQVPASCSPHVVPAPYSNAANVDPEEAYVAAISSCHMLSFLWVAARHKVVVDSYTDTAEGIMEPIGDGKEAVTRVELRPKVTYVGTPPDRATEEALHHEAHEVCFIANSVKTEIVTRLD